MAINFLPIIICVALLILAYIDVKYKKIPSIILTLLLFVVVAVNLENIGYGILAGIFGLLMFEFAEGNKTSFGIADIKVLAMIGFMISSFLHFAYFLIIFAVVQLFYIGYYRTQVRKKGEIPFIPALFIIYVLTWAVGGFAL